MDNLRKTLTHFFTTVDKSSTELERLVTESENSVNACCNLAKILRAVVRDFQQKSTQLALLTNVHPALIVTISSEIAKEVSSLKDFQNSIFAAFESLEKRETALKNAFQTALNSDPATSQFRRAVEAAEDCVQFFYAAFLQVSQILGYLDPENEESCDKLPRILLFNLSKLKQIYHQFRLDFD